MNREDVVCFVAIWGTILIVFGGIFLLATGKPCQTFDAEALTEAQVQVLLADGWRGDPTDHAETLYSPDC